MVGALMDAMVKKPLQLAPATSTEHQGGKMKSRLALGAFPV